MRLCIFGSGYVGLVAAACFAESGHSVVCVDINETKIKNLQSGVVPIFEPGLAEMIESAIESKKLSFTTDVQKGLDAAEVIFIAVGTPQDEDGSADLKYVLQVAKSIGQHIHKYTIIVNKSTVPVGTSDKVMEAIQAELDARKVTVDFEVVSNPEFLKEGAAIEDFCNPDRIVLGLKSSKAESIMRTLYAPFTDDNDCILVMDPRSAELTKYAANAMLATKISFMNFMATLAERVGADVDHIKAGIGSDPRIGPHFINPGCGYGGSCFPKDVQALINTSREASVDTALLSAVESVNENQKKRPFEKLGQHFKNQLKGKVIAVWGLAFKPGTDDMRCAPSLTLLELLWKEGAIVQAFDPEAMHEAERIFGQRSDFILTSSPEEALEGADALVILTEWRVFKSPSFEMMQQKLKNKVIVDGRNLYDPKLLAQMGFTYYGMGRGYYGVHSKRDASLSTIAKERLLEKNKAVKVNLDDL